MNSDNPSRALVTGASSGIGRATALAFARAGIDVALVSRSPEKLASVVEAAMVLGVVAKAYLIDLSELDAIQPAIKDLLEDFGAIDILINSAGIGYNGALATMPLADWQQVITLNLTSVFQCIQAALPILRLQSPSTIVNIASVAGKSPFPEWGAYSVSKAGVIALSKALAAEEKTYGVRVVTISPGAVNTPLWDTDTVQADFDRAKMLTPEVVAQTILNAVLLSGSAVVEDLLLMPSAGAF